LAARAVGINPANTLSRHVELMAGGVSRETAAQLGYVADSLLDAGNTLARLLGDTPGPEVTERISSFVLRAQGLSHWTDMGRVSFKMEMSASLAQNAGRKLADVDEPLRSMLSQRLTEADWQALSDPALLFRTDSGEAFLSPLSWRESAIRAGMDRKRADDLSLRLHQIIMEQQEMAVPTMNLEGRSMMQGAGRPGTVQGEVARSMTMYKSFPITVFINQFRRTMAQPTPMGRAQYFAAMLAGFTLMGAVGMQLKEMARGNDPRPMDDPKFWGASVLQGGGLGLAGDLFSSATDRTGRGLMEFVAGPVVGVISDVARATGGNALKAIQGDDVNLGRDAVRLAKRYTPGTNLWWSRMVTDRMLWDQLQHFLDPEADKEFRRLYKQQQRERGNEGFWVPGKPAPDRAPNLGAALGL